MSAQFVYRRDAERMLAQGRVRVAGDCRPDTDSIRAVQAVQRPQSMEPRQGIRRLVIERTRSRAASTPNPVAQAPRCARARPAAAAPWCATSALRMAQHRDERPVRRPGADSAVGASAAAVGFGPDPPDPPAIVPAAEVDGSPRRLGHELGMLDQLAVHVDDVECPVRTVRQVDRPEGRVGGRQELAALLGPARDEGHSGRLEHAAVNQVRQRLADEGVAVVGRRQQATALDRPARNWR